MELSSTGLQIFHVFEPKMFSDVFSLRNILPKMIRLLGIQMLKLVNLKILEVWLG